MKKDTAIKEDTKARQFAAVQRVVINNTSSGTSLWVPEEIAETDELSVTENGVYCAYDDNVFGYSQVVVNVSESLNDRSEKDKAISKITGTNPDTGDTESYGVDENGNLTKDVIPSGLPQAIHIVIEPTKKNYENGETLDFSGIHVYLLDGEGHQWTSDEYPTGEIPFDELIFPVTTAQDSEGEGSYSATTSENLPYTSDVRPPYVLGSSGNIKRSDGEEDDFAVTTRAAFFSNGTNTISVVAVGDSANQIVGVSKYIYNGDVISTSNITTTRSYTFNNQTVYYAVSESSYSQPSGTTITITCPSCNQGSLRGNDYGSIAWTLKYGTISRTQDIPVQWLRSDGETLEDSYDITVKGGNPSTNGNGESSSGGAHTGGDF